MSAEYQSSKETMNFARFSRLILDVIPDLFRDLLLSRLPLPMLNIALSNQKRILVRMLTKQQVNILFPKGHVFQGSLKELDTATLYALLRVLANISPHRRGWGKVPDIADRSLSANIDRLRIQRNEGFAHAKTAFLSDADFQARWTIIRQSIEDIQNLELKSGSFVEAVDHILTMNMETSVIDSPKAVSTDDTDIQKESKNKDSMRKKTQTHRKDILEKESKYKDSMRKKTQTQNIKLTFIGHARAGKTCLMRQLLRKPIKPGGPSPTNLAELLTKRLRYNLGKSAKEREKIKKGKEAELCRLRLRRLRKKQENKDPPNADSNGKQGQTNFDEDDPNSSEGVAEEPGVTMYQRDTPQHNITEDQREAVEDINKDDDSIDDSSVAYVTLHDFGGDEVFRNCNNCIMSANNIYLLVFDVSLWESPNEHDRVVDEITFWMNIVATYAKDEADELEGIPPILLIGSHMDKAAMDEKDICAKLWAELQEKNPGMADILEHHVREIICIPNLDNSDLNEEKYLHVWCEIERCVDLQSCWHDFIPGTWLALEEKIMLEKEKGIKYLQIRQIQDMNRELLVPLEENQIVTFLRYMHNAGSIFCFDCFGKTDTESLNEQNKGKIKVILDINWLIKAFGAIITDDKFVNLDSNKQRLLWNSYKATAMLTDEVLEIQWRNVKHEDREVLTSQMKYLGLITERIPKGFIVPCLLSEAEPDCIRQILNNKSVHCTKTLCLVFHHQFVQQAIWDKTVAFCLHKFSECVYQKRGNKRRKIDNLGPKRGFICRNVDDIWNFVLHCRGPMLKLTMFNHHEQPVIDGVGQTLRLEIENIVKTVLSVLNQGHRKFKHYLHCDFWIYDGESQLGKPKTETMRKCSKYRVEDSMGNVSFLTQNDLNAWFGDSSKVSPMEKFTDMTKVKQIHAKMVSRLSKWICPGLKERWGIFLNEVSAYLEEADLYGSDNSMSKICNCLMRDGVIDYGDYGKLREIVNYLHVKAVKIIDDAMVELNALRLSSQ